MERHGSHVIPCYPCSPLVPLPLHMANHSTPLLELTLPWDPLSIQNNYHHLPSSVPLYSVLLYSNSALFLSIVWCGNISTMVEEISEDIQIRGLHELLLALTGLLTNRISLQHKKVQSKLIRCQKCQIIAIRESLISILYHV